MAVRAGIRALVGRADLLEVAAALAEREAGAALDAAIESAARVLGFVREERAPTLPKAGSSEPRSSSGSTPMAVEMQSPPEDMLFWQAYSFAWHDDDDASDRVAAAAKEASAAAAADAAAVAAMQALARPTTPPLTPRSRLLPLLHRNLTAEILGRELDITVLIRRWTRGEHVGELPRRPLRRLPPLLVIVDRSHDLATLWDDMDGLLRLLGGQLGARALTVWELEPGDGPEELPFMEAPMAGPAVLALTDLGWHSGSSRRRAWLRLGRQLRRAGQRIHALVPVPPARWTEALTRVWSPLAWERPSGADPGAGEREVRASRLLDLAAQARRLEPGLLRALRMLLPRGVADVGTEVDAWLHGDLASRCPGATVIRAERAEVRRARFAAEEESAVKAQVAEAIRGWHARRRPELLSMELLALAERGAAVAEADLRRAERVLVGIERRARGAAESGDLRARAEIGHWLDYVARQAPALFDPSSAAGRALQPAWGATHDPDEAPPYADPGLLAQGRGAPREASEVFEVCQVGDGLGVWPRVQARDRRVPPGGSVGALWAGDLRIYPSVPGGAPPRPVRITSPARIPAPPAPGAVIELRTDRSSLVLRAFARPSWATAIGRDHRGLWAELEVEGVAVRLRWIVPGHFVMGSPSDEPGRDDDEVEHEVVLTRGFWLGETAVTQRLWRVVMGDNPSRFQDPQRPVERVSWKDAERFLGELNRRIDADADGAAFRLPSEAEWEYACRAGTRTATYAGPVEIRGENDAPVLDGIAWYGGNSGVDYDLGEAEDSSSWPKKQHEHSRAGTHRVGDKLPNPWGLHDMLGNVWEWCADAWQKHRTASSVSTSAGRPASSASGSASVLVDPYVAGRSGARRVNRGGSWYSAARNVRAACRLLDLPGDRGDGLGLRLARGQGLKGPDGQPPGGR